MLYEDPEPTPIKPLLETMVRALVEYPDNVDIYETETHDTLIYQIDVVRPDRGKIIGRRGSILKSFETFFYALGCKQGKRVRLEIYDG